MKTLLKLMIAMLLTIVTASAQFIPGPQIGSVITISTNYRLPGITKTNIPTTAANLIPVGKNGIGFYARVGASNAATTTNMTFTLEQFVTGNTTNAVDWVTDHTFTLTIAPSGTTGVSVYTNFLPTTVNLLNARYLRIKSIDNTNLNDAFITNFTWSIRE